MIINLFLILLLFNMSKILSAKTFILLFITVQISVIASEAPPFVNKGRDEAKQSLRLDCFVPRLRSGLPLVVAFGSSQWQFEIKSQTHISVGDYVLIWTWVIGIINNAGIVTRYPEDLSKLVSSYPRDIAKVYLEKTQEVIKCLRQSPALKG